MHSPNMSTDDFLFKLISRRRRHQSKSSKLYADSRQDCQHHRDDRLAGDQT